MKIAYLILCHAHPQQVIRTIEALRPSSALFAIHVDARAERQVYDQLAAYASSAGGVFMTRRHRCYWGKFALVEATLECIKTALAHPAGFDYAMLISGMDYPIKRAGEIASFLGERMGSEFIEAFPLAERNRWTDMDAPFQSMSRVEHWHLSFRSKSVHIRWKRRFYRGWEPYGGSQWWCLSIAAVSWIQDYVARNPLIIAYFRTVFIPDEAMFHSMIFNSRFGDRIAGDLHYVDWVRSNPAYPRTLDEDDFDRLRSSCKLVARKMHPAKSSRLLDRIDRELLCDEGVAHAEAS